MIVRSLTRKARCSPLAGYRNYRKHLARVLASGTRPIVPYMPCVLGDLAMQGEGNATLVDGMVNMLKIEMLGARVYEALRFQPAEYEVEQDRSLIMYFFSTELTLDEDDLYRESQRQEPVGAKADRVSRKFFAKSLQLLSSATPGRFIPRARANSVHTHEASRLSLAHPATCSSAPLTGVLPMAAATSLTASSAAVTASTTISATATAGAQAQSHGSPVSKLCMAKLQIPSMHQSVVNAKPAAASAAQRTRLARSGSWPPESMRSLDSLPAAVLRAAAHAASNNAEGTCKVSLEQLPPPEIKLSGNDSQAHSGPTSLKSQRGSRVANNDAPECEPAARETHAASY